MTEAYHQHFNIRLCQSVIIKLHSIAYRVFLDKQSCCKLGMVKCLYLSVSVMILSYLKVAAVIGLLVVFYFVFQYVSYILATVILIVGTSVLLGYRNWKILIPVAVVMSVALYLVFWKVFNVHFPAPFY